MGSNAYINLKLARALLAHLDNVCHFVLAYSMQVLLGILVRMRCMGAHGSAVYSSERTYVHASNVAGLWRSVLDSVGWYIYRCWWLTMESVRSMRLRKMCPKCGAVVHAKRAVCYLRTTSSYSKNTFPPMLSTTSVSDH